MTMMFIAGFGAGTCVIGLIFIYVLGTVTKGSKKSEEHMRRTDELLTERNAIGTKIEKHLSVLAAWCDENWKRGGQ